MQTAQQAKKTLNEVLQDGRKKLGMDLATLKTGLNGKGVREEDLSESNPR